MSDQPSPRPRRPAQPPALSKESRFIGYLVLGFGLLAVITVIIIAVNGKSGDQSPQDETAAQLVQGLVDTPVSKPPAPKKELVFPRSPDVDESDMQGAWQAAIGRYTSVLQFNKGVYQIIMASPDPNAVRLYSSGTYKGLEDILVLTPKLDWPQPVSPEGKKITYDMLTRAPFPVIVLFDKGKMIWQNPPQSERRVLVPYKNPLLVDDKEHYIVWSKLD